MADNHTWLCARCLRVLDDLTKVDVLDDAGRAALAGRSLYICPDCAAAWTRERDAE